MEHLHFKLRGDDFTRLVRNRVLDGEWEHAVLILITGLVGITHDQAYEILSGRKMLTGDEHGMELVDDTREDTTKYLRDVNFIYGGVYYEGGKWWKPYGYVDSFGYADLVEIEGEKITKKNGWKRAYFYSRNGRQDLVKQLYDPKTAKVIPSPGIILFEHVANPPIWMVEELRKNTAMVSACTNMRYLQRFGATPDQWEGKFKQMDKEIDKVVPPVKEPTKINISDRVNLQHDCGWVLPDGTFYGCNYSEHNYLAFDIFEQKYGMPDVVDANRAACDRGWIKIGHSMFVGDKEMDGYYCFVDKKPTQAQLNTVAEWCEKHKKPYPKDTMESFDR